LFRLTRPSELEVKRFISRQSQATFSYVEVGASAGNPPSHYNTDRTRVQIGKGEAVWNRAVDAVRRWQMFNVPWLRLYWPNSSILPGTVVALVVHHFGFWSLNACRIVYIVEDRTPERQEYGFAYGTLRDHAEQGEERFTVEWNHTDDSVWYNILAFSRPRKLLATLGYPLTRSLQRRFAMASGAAMVAAANDRSHS
jgi:uncharacterized protein (UPF0548 family)